MRSSKLGTSTSAVKFGEGIDPIEIMILEENLRIIDLLVYKKLDLLVVVLNSGDVLQMTISEYPRLKKASEAVIRDWRTIGGGIGIHWEKLDEDISLKGLIRSSTRMEALRKFSRAKHRASKGV
jgi:hypothetical protein